MFANGRLNLTGGRLGAGGLSRGRDCDPTYVARVYRPPCHRVSRPWNGRLGVPHEEVIVVFNHRHELEEGLFVIIVCTTRTSVPNFIHDQTSLWKVECDWVYIVSIENNTRYFREGCDARPCCVFSLFLPGVHLFSN